MASIRKLPSGRYRVRWRDAQGQEHGITAPTKKAALEVKAETEHNLFRGVHRDPKAGQQPFGAYVEDVLETSLDLRPSTQALYRIEASRYVIPRLGGMPLVAIQPADLRKLYAALLRDGVGKPTVEVTHRLISRVLTQAVEDGLIPVNPATSAKAPRAERKPVRVLDPADAIWLAVVLETGWWSGYSQDALAVARQEFNEACPDDWRRLGYFKSHSVIPFASGRGVMALLGMFAGLRFGEAAALRVSSVAFGDRPRITVTQALSEVSGHVEIGPTKTKGSRRSIPLPSRVADAIEGYVRWCAEERTDYYRHIAGRIRTVAELGELADPDPLLFVTKQWHPLSRTRFRSRIWVPAVEAAKLEPPPNFHDLRHSYAAWQIAQRAHTKELQELMGHTSSRTTLDRYGHLMDTLESQQHERMDEALRGSGGTYVARALRVVDPREA